MSPSRTRMAEQYSAVDAYSGALGADPHRLVQLMLEGALTRLAEARGCIVRGRIGDKAAHLARAMGLVQGLRASLDCDTGGELARNLDDLYDYMERRLLRANADNDPAALDEVSALLREIKAGWDAIAPAPVRAAG